MATNSAFADDALTLRRVVSELRWLLTHHADLRSGVIRTVHRYEDDLARRAGGDETTLRSGVSAVSLAGQ